MLHQHRLDMYICPNKTDNVLYSHTLHDLFMNKYLFSRYISTDAPTSTYSQHRAQKTGKPAAPVLQI